MRKKIIPFLATAVGAVASLGLGTQLVSENSPAEPQQEVASVTTRNSSTRQTDSGTNNKLVRRSVGLRGMNFNYNSFGGDYSQFAKDPGMSPKQYGIYLMRSGQFTRNRLKRKMLC